ncbi:MAG: hypothetical protein ACOYT4_03035 [Nanoarchaeota archaeon]
MKFGITREELRRMHPEYDSLSAFEKLKMESKYHTNAGNFIKDCGYIGTLAGAILSPLVIYSLYKQGCTITKPDFLSYLAGEVLFSTFSFHLGAGIGQFTYELFGEEGEYNLFELLGKKKI